MEIAFIQQQFISSDPVTYTLYMFHEYIVSKFHECLVSHYGIVEALLKFFIKNKEHTFSYRVSREKKKINSAYDQASLAIFFTLADTGRLSSIKCSMHKTFKYVFLFYDN